MNVDSGQTSANCSNIIAMVVVITKYTPCILLGIPTATSCFPLGSATTVPGENSSAVTGDDVRQSGAKFLGFEGVNDGVTTGVEKSQEYEGLV